MVSIAQLKARWLGFSEVCTQGAVFKSVHEPLSILRQRSCRSCENTTLVVTYAQVHEDSCCAADPRASLICLSR